MKRIAIAISLIALALPAGASSLSVNGTAALEGSFGLEVNMDGVTDAAYVLDETPNNETIYRAEFLVDWNDLTYLYCLPQASSVNKLQAYHGIATIWDLDGATTREKQFINILFKCIDDGGAEMRPVVFARTYDPTHPSSGGTGMLYRDDVNGAIAVNLPYPSQSAGYPVAIRVEYQQASGVGTNDGMLKLERANNFAPGVFSGKIQSSLRQNTRDVDRFQWGATGGVDAGTTGSYYFDSFESYRTLAP